MVRNYTRFIKDEVAKECVEILLKEIEELRSLVYFTQERLEELRKRVPIENPLKKKTPQKTSKPRTRKFD